MRKSQKHCFHLKKISSTIDLFFTFATVTYVLSASENTLMVFLQTNKISFSPTRVLTGSTRWGWQVRPSNPPISLSRGTENCHLLQWDKGEAQGQFPLGPVETLGEGGSCFSFSVGVGWRRAGVAKEFSVVSPPISVLRKREQILCGSCLSASVHSFGLDVWEIQEATREPGGLTRDSLPCHPTHP